MWKQFKIWFEHKFNPHCSHCALEKMDEMICPSCEMLKTQLALANEEKRLMLEALISPISTTVNRTSPDDSRAGQMIGVPRHVPWSVKRQQLEQEDRAKAHTIQRQQKDDADARELAKTLKPIEPASIEDLEKELGLVDEDSRPSVEEKKPVEVY